MTDATILLTRPRAQSETFAEALRGAVPPDVAILVSPILEIRTLGLSGLQGRPRFLVLTSAHAAQAISRSPGLAGCVAYCVGGATAEAACRAGADAIAAGGTAAELIERIRSDRPEGPGLYLRGRHVSVDLAAELEKSGIKVESSVVYEQVPAELNTAARQALDGSSRVVLPVFSARSARLLAAAAQGARATLAVVAISPQVAAEWPDSAQIAGIAATPDASGMVAAVSASLTG